MKHLPFFYGKYKKSADKHAAFDLTSEILCLLPLPRKNIYKLNEPHVIGTSLLMKSYLPHHRIPTEENIDSRFLVVIYQVAPNRTSPVAKNHDPRAQTTVNFVAL